MSKNEPIEVRVSYDIPSKEGKETAIYLDGKFVASWASLEAPLTRDQRHLVWQMLDEAANCAAVIAEERQQATFKELLGL